jgi:hypothetical protein
MTDPLSFPSTTPRYRLPLLFAGQSQKEVAVNGAHALADMLLHPAVEGESAASPAAAADGDCWLVGASATGLFAGQEGSLACRQADVWTFTPPQDGMRLFDRSSGQFLLFAGGWRREVAIAQPAGGTTIDAEARASIVAILHLLQRTGMLPAQ